MQQRYLETHEFLTGEEGGTPFGNGTISDEQLSQRDNVTQMIETGADEVPWPLLAKATLGLAKDGTPAPVYPEAVQAFDRQTVAAKGYIFPLDQAEKQAHFLLSPYPPSCPFCLPAGPSELIEVQLKSPIAFTYAPVTVRGRFSLLRGSEAKEGMFYRLDDAEAVR